MRQEDGQMAWTGRDMPDGIPCLASNALPLSAQQALAARVLELEEIVYSLQRYLQPKEPANFAHRLDMAEAHIVALRSLLRLPPPDAPDSDGYQRKSFDSWQAVARTAANLSIKLSQMEMQFKPLVESIAMLRLRLDALERRGLPSGVVVTLPPGGNPTMPSVRAVAGWEANNPLLPQEQLVQGMVAELTAVSTQKQQQQAQAGAGYVDQDAEQKLREQYMNAYSPDADVLQQLKVLKKIITEEMIEKAKVYKDKE